MFNFLLNCLLFCFICFVGFWGVILLIGLLDDGYHKLKSSKIFSKKNSLNDTEKVMKCSSKSKTAKDLDLHDISDLDALSAIKFDCVDKLFLRHILHDFDYILVSYDKSNKIYQHSSGFKVIPFNTIQSYVSNLATYNKELIN